MLCEAWLVGAVRNAAHVLRQVQDERGLRENTEATMLVYDENITIKDWDGTVIGRCHMLGWVITSDSGVKSWMGEFLPIAGKPLDFDFPSIEKSGLRVECEDGATAKILTPMIEDARSFGSRCTFEGIWPPPRPVS